MRLQAPVIITARLMAGVKVGDDAFISIEYAGNDRDGRNIYRYYIDAPSANFSVVNNDIKGWGGLQEGLESLLSFLGAAAESYDYAKRMGKELSDTENGELFPANVTEWAYMNDSELSQLRLELEENAELIEE